MTVLPRPVPALLLAVLAFLVPEAPARGHVPDPRDEVLKAIGIDEKLGAPVPAALVFRDQDGKPVRLGDLYGSGPVILTLNYYTCPMLCPLTLRGLQETAAAVEGLSLTRDYRIVTVSIDPADTPGRARDRAREVYAGMAGVRDPASRWPFLTGDEEAIDALAKSVGFRYRKVGAEFAHPDAGIVLTPDGRVSRYLYGMQQSPRDLKLALIEAAGGRIGASEILHRALLFCFHYDPVSRKYALYARNIMKAGGVLTLVVLGGLYLFIWKRRKGGPAPAEGR